MGLLGYTSKTLRALTATAGANEQDAAVTIPAQTTEMWVVAEKTAEANPDNLLTIRIQAQVGSDWFDLAWESTVTTVAVGTQADGAVVTTRAANIYDGGTDATFAVLAYYKGLPSNVLRVVSVSSGTAVANTFSVTAFFQTGNIAVSDVI